jgi:glycosyltransferase involved in cell wall biosynthesis
VVRLEGRLRILICHGYLLKGTGSNQYVQSLARALCRLGHNLVVACQDYDPRLDFVNAFLREKPGVMNPQVVWEQETPYTGTCMVYKPDIGGLLPVYVMDSYRGFEVKEFVDLTAEELDEHVERYTEALARLVDQFVPEVAHVNHAVMLPYVMRSVSEESGIPYLVSLHGSAVDFTVRRDERYLEYGALGLAGASRVVATSRHSAEAALEVFRMVDGLADKISIIPPGVDTELFKPASGAFAESVEVMLAAVEERTRTVTVADFAAAGKGGRDPALLQEKIDGIAAENPDWLPDSGLAVNMRALVSSEAPFVTYLGKLLETKGVQCLPAALPLLLRKHPGTRLVIIGFGELRGILELMLRALDQGDVRGLRDICVYGNSRYTLLPNAFSPVLDMLEEMAGENTLDDYLRLCRELPLAESVIFTGYLTPEEHRHVLPYSKALVVPSLADEAFGLVATEAMACGVIPVASYHSGLVAALEPLVEVLGDEAEALRLGTPDKIIFRIAAACGYVLSMTGERRRRTGSDLRDLVERGLSWEAVCLTLIDIYADSVEPRGPTSAA